MPKFQSCLKIIILVFFLFSFVSACGRKSALINDGEKKNPDFSNVSDE